MTEFLNTETHTPVLHQIKTKTTIKNRETRARENLVDDRVPEHRDSHASSSHEASLEPTTKRSEDLDKHSVYTHFPKDRNCEICQRTKITRAPCRTRNSGAVPRAENFGDLITADHKVLSAIANLETITDTQSWCRT